MSTTGALILAFFATIWWVVGLRAAGHGSALVYPVPALAAAVLAVVYWAGTRRGGAARPDGDAARAAADAARRGRIVGWASGAEGVAIFLAAVVLGKTGHQNALAPVVALIVGAHFVPLARGLPAPAYYATAAALAVLGVAGLAIADLPTRLTVVCAGAAAVLWLTAVSALRRSACRAKTAPHGSPRAETVP